MEVGFWIFSINISFNVYYSKAQIQYTQNRFIPLKYEQTPSLTPHTLFSLIISIYLYKLLSDAISFIAIEYLQKITYLVTN